MVNSIQGKPAYKARLAIFGCIQIRIFKKPIQTNKTKTKPKKEKKEPHQKT